MKQRLVLVLLLAMTTHCSTSKQMRIFPRYRHEEVVGKDPRIYTTDNSAMLFTGSADNLPIESIVEQSIDPPFLSSDAKVVIISTGKSSSNCPTSTPSRPRPTVRPTSVPSCMPWRSPSILLSLASSADASIKPLFILSISSSELPPIIPTAAPTVIASQAPSCLLSCCQPTDQPTSQPNRFPSAPPSEGPIDHPSDEPSIQRFSRPSYHPIGLPSSQPSVCSSMLQSLFLPTCQPTIESSIIPSAQPSAQPSRTPNATQSTHPPSSSSQPSTLPSRQTSSASVGPSMQPTAQLSNQPLGHPSHQPTRQPLTLPTSTSASSHHHVVTETEHSPTTARESPKEVQSTFMGAPRSSSAERNSIVYSFLWSIAGAMVLGLIFFGCWDFTHPTGRHSSINISSHRISSLDDDCERNLSCARRGIGEFFESLYPDRLRPSEWYAMLYKQLRREHPLWKLFVTADDHDRHSDTCSCVVLSRSFSWVGFIAGLVAWTCSCTIIVYVWFTDDGRCEAITDHSSCANAGPSSWLVSSIGWRPCGWRWDNDTCVFRGSNHSSFPTVMALALVAGALSSPIRRFTDRMVVYIYLLWRRRRGRNTKKFIIPSLIQRVDRQYHDEFSQASSKRSTWLRAARLAKLQESMDLISPEQEAVAIQRLLSSGKRRWDEDAWSLGDRNEWCMSSSFDNRITIVSQVNDCRAEAIRLRALCEEVQRDDAKEALLMRHFIVGLFGGYRKRVVASFLFGANSNQLLQELITNDSTYYRLLRYGSCAGLPLLLAVMLYCIAVLGASIGSKSIDLWLVLVLVGIVVDNFAIQVIVAWLTWSVIYNSVFIEFESIMRNLKGKSRIILRRTTGVMRPCNDLVQHLNPACRVARMFPVYPICRLLLSINDGDIADKVDPSRRRRWDYDAIGCSVGWVMYLPQVISAVALDWMALLLFDGGLLAVFHFGRYSLVAACTVVGSLLAVAVVWIARIEWQYFRVRLAKQRAYNLRVFRQVDEEDEIKLRAMKSQAQSDPLDSEVKQDDTVVYQKAVGSVIRKHSVPSAVRHMYLRSKGVQVAPSPLTADPPPQQVAADAPPLASIDISIASTDDSSSIKASLSSLLVRGGYPRPTKALSGPPLSSLVNRVFGPAVDAEAFDPQSLSMRNPCPDVTNVPDLQQYVDAERDFASTFGKIWNPVHTLLEFRSKKSPLPRGPAASSDGDDEVGCARPLRTHRSRVHSRGAALLPTDQQGENVETHLEGPGAALLKWDKAEEERTNISTQLLQSMSKPASAVDLYNKRTATDLHNYTVFLARAKQSRSFDRFVPSSPDIDFALIAGSSAAAIVSAEATQSALASSGYRLNSGGARARVRGRSNSRLAKGEDRKRAVVDEGPGDSRAATLEERRAGR